MQELEEEMLRAEPHMQQDLLQQQIDAMEFSDVALDMVLSGTELTRGTQEALEKARRTEQDLVAALEAEAPVRAWQRRAPLKGLARWNAGCAHLAFHGEEGLDSTGKEFVEAMRAYLAAAEKDGITKPVGAHGARTEMYGCGAKRYEGSTYRWDYDGTYITASDSQTTPSERTYWTDEDGRLVGKAKGGPGQKWTIAPYEAPASPPQQVDLDNAYLTGLFGPLASVVRLIGPVHPIM